MNYSQLAAQIADLFAALPQVEAVALGGSRGSGPGASDSASDIDLYVYTRGDVALATRRTIMEHAGGASQANIGLEYWGPGDEWLHAPTGIEVDIVYFDVRWMEEQISRVVDQHRASLGYSTCFWYTVRQSIVLHDSAGWFAGLYGRCQVPYPEPLRRNIVAFNHPVLRGIIPSYAAQLAKAAKRGDLISLNHRLAALFASYFDIVLAVNRQLHPGEKRLVEFTVNNCARLPMAMEAEISELLHAAALDAAGVTLRAHRLLDHLDHLIRQEGFD